MSWLSAILSILVQGLQAFTGWQKASEKQDIKQDGRNEEKLENITIINERKRNAKSIIDRVLKREKADSDK